MRVRTGIGGAACRAVGRRGGGYVSLHGNLMNIKCRGCFDADAAASKGAEGFKGGLGPQIGFLPSRLSCEFFLICLLRETWLRDTWYTGGFRCDRDKLSAWADGLI